MTLLASFAVLLARYTGQRDLVVGVPAAGRTHTELEPMIGMFVNTLPIRIQLADDPPFHELLERVRQATTGAYAHQELPFDRLVAELSPRGRPGSLHWSRYCSTCSGSQRIVRSSYRREKSSRVPRASPSSI